MLPDLTAFMISNSCGIKVLPKNCISSAPFDCAFTSFAIQSNATAADSGIALICANTSFFGWACANAGARPVARMPAMPAPARRSARRLNETRLVGADMGSPPKPAFLLRSDRRAGRPGPVRRQAYSMAGGLPVGMLGVGLPAGTIVGTSRQATVKIDLGHRGRGRPVANRSRFRHSGKKGKQRPACFLPPAPLYWLHAYPDRRRGRCCTSLFAAADVSRGQSRHSGPRDQDRRRRGGARGRRLYRYQGRTRGRNPAWHLWRGAIGLVAFWGFGVRQYRPDVRGLGDTTIDGAELEGPLAVSRYEPRSRQRRTLRPDPGRAICRPFPWRIRPAAADSHDAGLRHRERGAT